MSLLSATGDAIIWSRKNTLDSIQSSFEAQFSIPPGMATFTRYIQGQGNTWGKLGIIIPPPFAPAMGSMNFGGQGAFIDYNTEDNGTFREAVIYDNGTTRWGGTLI